MARLLPALSLFIVLLPTTSSARTWHISPDGLGDAATIQAGVDSAAAGDSVLLASGTYSGDGNRDISFHGKAIVVASEASDPDQCTVRCDGTESEPHNGFDFHSGEGAAAKVSGITVTGGWSQYGGGVHCDEGTGPTIGNCALIANTALSYGGGISCDYHSTPTVINCRIVGNQTTRGDAGGLDCFAASVTVRGCTISGNQALYAGGGVRCLQCSPTFEGCDISNNVAGSFGGGISSSAGSPRIRDCIFGHNSSATMGGGLDFNSDAPAEVVSCTFDSNSAPTCGGAIACGASGTIWKCTFFDNSSARGSGLFYWGCGTPAVVVNCIFAFSAAGNAVDYACNLCPALSCCDVYGNAGGDWVGCIAGQFRVHGNFSACPSFCDADHGDFHLCDQSPCLPGQNPYHYNCGLVGSWGQGCWCGPSKTEPTTWGAIKAMYK